jgi:RNA polymerase sigma-70 factor (ECF subfamily)
MKYTLIVEIYNQYYFDLLRFAKKIVPICEAEDCVQELFYNLLTLRIDPETCKTPSELRRYMYVCLKNLCIDSIRHNKIEYEAIDRSTTEEFVEYIESQYIQNDIVELVLNELNKLSPRSKTIIRMYYIEGFHAREIAAQFGLQTRTVECYLYRTLCRLKKACKYFYK